MHALKRPIQNFRDLIRADIQTLCGIKSHVTDGKKFPQLTDISLRRRMLRQKAAAGRDICHRFRTAQLYKTAVFTVGKCDACNTDMLQIDPQRGREQAVPIRRRDDNAIRLSKLMREIIARRIKSALCNVRISLAQSRVIKRSDVKSGKLQFFYLIFAF